MKYENEVIFVSGQRGSGKTFWVQHYIKTLSRVLIYDSLSEYEAANRFEDLDSLIGFLETVGENWFEVIFDPLDPQDEFEFSIFCRVAQSVGRLHVVIEEIDLFATPFLIPRGLQELIKYGRHRAINLVGVSRRPAEVSRLFTSQASRFILFRQIEPRDIQYFKSIIGDSADMLPTLEPYHFLDIDFSKGILAQRPIPQKI